MNFTKLLCSLTKELNVQFILNDKTIKSEEVFADTGLLPAFARRADQLSLLCLGYGIGVNFVDAEKAILGVQVQFDEVTPNALRLACFYDVILEMVEAAPAKDKVVLDELMYD